MFHIASASGGPPLPDGLGGEQTRALLERCFATEPAERPTAAELIEDGALRS